MSESGMAAVGGRALGRLGQYLYERWLMLRSLLIGLRIAWVSTASAVIGLLLFFGAAPAQDILLEVNHDGLWRNLTSWIGFYGLVIFFWALPVFMSARWILARFQEGSDSHAHMEPVPAWVRSRVPAFLAALCLIAVLTGQLMAVRVSPPASDNAPGYIAEAESAVRKGEQLGACTQSFKMAGCATFARDVAVVVGSKIVRRNGVVIVALGVALLLAFWLYLSRRTVLARLSSMPAIRKGVMAAAASVTVATGYLLVALAAESVLGRSLWRPLLLAPLVLAIAAIIWLAWAGRERLLRWLGTIFGLAAAVVMVLAIWGNLEIERKGSFGLAHLYLLPFATAAAAAIALWGLSWRSSGQATRFGQLLLWLTGAKGAHSDQMATVRLVNPIFYGLVVITVALNVLFIVAEPVNLTEDWGVNRSSLLPIVLGLPVAAFTWLSYGSARSRVPLVLAVLAFLGAWNMLWGVLGRDYYAVRTIELSKPRPILNDAVEQWAAANGCRLPTRPGPKVEASKEDAQKEPCPTPIIMAAAGGASRAAFHLAGVIGKLLDGEKFAPLGGHKGIVYSAAFNGDGSLIATASIDKTVRIWDGKSGTLIRSLLGHKGRVQSAAFSRDGKRMVTASWDRTAKVWDVSDPQKIKILAVLPHPRDVNSAAFSPDDGGRLVVTGSDDGMVRIWQWETIGNEPIEFKQPHRNYVYGVAFSPTGKYVVTASWDRTAKVWDVSNLDDIKELKTLPHPADVNSATFMDDKLIVTGADDGRARIWEWENDPPRARELSDKNSDGGRAHEGLVFGVAFSPRSKRVVTAGWDRTAKVWDVSNLDAIRLVHELKGHKGDVNSAAFSPDGKLIVTASDDKTARLWNAETGEREPWDDSGQFRPFGKQLFAISAVSGGALGAAVTYAALADSQSKSGDTKEPPCNREGLKDRDWFAAVGGGLEPTTNPKMSWKACLQLLVAGDFLSPVVVGLTRDPLPFKREDRAALLEKSWEKRYFHYTKGAQSKDAAARALLAGGTLTKGLTTIRRDIEKVGKGWLPVLLLNGTSVEDGKRIVTSDIDMSIQVGRTTDRVFYDAYDFHKLLAGFGHDGIVYAVAAAGGDRIVTAAGDKTARIWNLKTGTLIAEAAGHGARVQDAAFSRDGKRLVTASWDGTARIWDLSDPKKIEAKTVLSHGSDVNSAAFSPDGRLIATGADDGRVRIWEAETGVLKADVQRAHRHFVFGVAFSPDGKRLVSASWDRTVKIWDVSNLEKIEELKTLEHGSDVNSAAFSPIDGKLIVTGADDGKARLWDAETGEMRAESPKHDGLVYGTAFSPDGQRVVTASWDGTAMVWDVTNPGEFKELMTLRHPSDVNRAAFSPDGKFIITGADDGRVRIWDAKTGQPVWQRCAECDVGLSTSVTMSARFPVVSPTGTFLDLKGKTRSVVDGGYYENFGATTAMELARVLKRHWGLEPMVVLVNNDHEVAGLECVTRDRRADVAAAWLWSPVNTVIGTRTARGSHAAVTLCEELQELAAKDRRKFAFITVDADKTNEHMTLSVSWWMSKNVQSYLDRQLSDDINRTAFREIDRIRQTSGPRPVSLLGTTSVGSR
jgi:WD40 repeat protein